MISHCRFGYQALSTSAGEVIEVAESDVFKHCDTFRELCGILRGFRCRVGVEHFGRQFSQIGLFHDPGFDYIKFDVRFIRRLNTNPGIAAFLKGAATIVHGAGLRAIAEGVALDTEFAALAVAGMDGVTDPGTTGSTKG